MAKVKEKRSFASVIRSYFEENPDWLDGPSNQSLIERYLKDHPGETWSKKHQQGAANEKTKMRKKLGKVRRRRRKGAATAVTNSSESRVLRVRTSISSLEQVELLIDECLSLAIRQGNPALDGVIKHLRVARRGVAWAMGEPSSAKI
jgi:hypothetical protein